MQSILDNVKKGITLEQTRDAFRWTHDLALDTHAHVMLGMPGETKETLRRTIGFVKEIRPTTASFGICTPYPGTPLFEEVARRDQSIRDGSAADLGRLHSRSFLNEHFTQLEGPELERSVRAAYRGFYLRPGYLWQRLGAIGDRRGLRSAMIAGLNVVAFSLWGE